MGHWVISWRAGGTEKEKERFGGENESHCKKISIYVFPEKELRGFSSNFHIHASVSDLYIATIGPAIFLQQNMQTARENI